MPDIALADDHSITRVGMAKLVHSLGYTVSIEAGNGEELIRQLNVAKLPDLVLMDINMPVMDGFETALWLRRNQPAIKILVLSMYDNETSIIRMLKCGARGYILKSCDTRELQCAIDDVLKTGFHYSDFVSGKLFHAIGNLDEEGNDIKYMIDLNEKDIAFLKLATSELTYKEIADKMNISPRTVDGYREILFRKLNIKTRVGLAIYAIKNGIVQV